MNIKTKFNVGDFAQFKIQRTPENRIVVMQITEIHSTVCYSATQVFYFTTEVFLKKDFEHSYKEEGKFNWIIGRGVNRGEDFKLGWIKVREDELIDVPKETMKLLK